MQRWRLRNHWLTIALSQHIHRNILRMVDGKLMGASLCWGAFSLLWQRIDSASASCETSVAPVRDHLAKSPGRRPPTRSILAGRLLLQHPFHGHGVANSPSRPRQWQNNTTSLTAPDRAARLAIICPHPLTGLLFRCSSATKYGRDERLRRR